MAVFCHDSRNLAIFRPGFIAAMEKDDAIRVLFDRSRVPKLAEARLPAVGLPVQLNAEEDRQSELEGEEL